MPSEEETRIDVEIDQPSLVEVYTEVSPERARALLQGVPEPPAPPTHYANRWLAETILVQFQPDHLQKLGITRNQPIFTSPTPYQGGKPARGRELLVLEMDPGSLFVAESRHVSELITPGFSPSSLQRIQILKSMKLPDRPVSKEEFDAAFQALPETQRQQLETIVEEPAIQYWNSVMSYQEYMAAGHHYEEPEILTTPATQIHSISRASNTDLPPSLPHQ